MPLFEPSALAAATVIGATSSVHCFLMCGPLACAATSSGARRGASSKEGLLRTAVAYQASRWAAYVVVGALAGVFGAGVSSVLRFSAEPYLLWLIAAALVLSALDAGRKLRPLPGVSRLLGVAVRVSAQFSPAVRAGAVGALTPLIPCGVLYAALLLAAATGSAIGGAALLGAFAAGAMPALAFAQLQKRLWPTERPTVAFVLRRLVPLCAAVVLIVRAAMASASDGAPRCH